jgi:hypothetical protein
MREVSASEKILMPLGLVFSAAGFRSLLMLRGPPPLSRRLLRLGFFAALYSCLWLFILCWVATLVFVLRMKGPSLYKAGMIPFWLGGIVMVFVFLGRRLSFVGVMLTGHSVVIPHLARRLVKMRFTTEEDTMTLPDRGLTDPFAKSVRA